MQRIAIIDLGTNTFKLLLVDVHTNGTHEVILRNKIPVKLAEGGVGDNIITTDAFQRGINALNTFKYNIIDYFGVKKVFAFATAGIRSTSNGLWFTDYVKKHVGIDIQIISGEEEAELIYEGAKKAVDLGDSRFLICDIGGGSTELIIGDKDKVYWKQSFRLGASRLIEKFKMSDPITRNERKNLELYFERKLEPLGEALQKYPVEGLIGSSGAFSTLSRMTSFMKYNKDTDKNQLAVPLDLEALSLVHKKVLETTHEERKFVPGIKLIRVEMMVAASIFVNFLIQKYRFEKVVFSDYALKEGVIAQVINKVQQKK